MDFYFASFFFTRKLIIHLVMTDAYDVMYFFKLMYLCEEKREKENAKENILMSTPFNAHSV
jgi:hypothetical protein